MAATNVQFSVALHIMAGLAFYQDQQVTSADLASSVNATPSFVRQVLSKLSKRGLIAATVGKNGACVLARDPKQITLLEIYKAVEPPPAFAIHSYTVQRSCAVSSKIKKCMKYVLDESQTALESSLAKQTVADLVSTITGV
jgi:Rrf2 family protein